MVPSVSSFVTLFHARPRRRGDGPSPSPISVSLISWHLYICCVRCLRAIPHHTARSIQHPRRPRSLSVLPTKPPRRPLRQPSAVHSARALVAHIYISRYSIPCTTRATCQRCHAHHATGQQSRTCKQYNPARVKNTDGHARNIHMQRKEHARAGTRSPPRA